MLKYLVFLQVISVFYIFVNGGSMTSAKVYQRFHDDKKVEEHCVRMKKSFKLCVWGFWSMASRLGYVLHFWWRDCWANEPIWWFKVFFWF